MSKFHERFIQLKNESGVLQKDLAQALGITQQSLSYYLNGREPGYDLLIKIVQYFNCTTDYILGVSDYRNIEEKEIFDDSFKELSKNINLLSLDDKSKLLKYLNAILNYTLTDFNVAEIIKEDEIRNITIDAFLTISSDLSTIMTIFNISACVSIINYQYNYIKDHFPETEGVSSLIEKIEKTPSIPKEVIFKMKKLLPQYEQFAGFDIDFTMMSAKYVYDMQSAISVLITKMQSYIDNNPSMKKIEHTPKLKNVKILADNIIVVTFENDEMKKYDVTSCLRNPKYRSKGTKKFTDEEVLKTIRISYDGYFLQWLDSIGFRTAYAIWSDGIPVDEKDT